MDNVFGDASNQKRFSICKALSTAASIVVCHDIAYGLLQLSRRCCGDACLGWGRKRVL